MQPEQRRVRQEDSAVGAGYKTHESDRDLAEIVSSTTQRLLRAEQLKSDELRSAANLRSAELLFTNLKTVENSDQLVKSLIEFLQNTKQFAHIPVGTFRIEWETPVSGSNQDGFFSKIGRMEPEPRCLFNRESLVLTGVGFRICQIPPGANCENFGEPGSSAIYRKIGSSNELLRFTANEGDIALVFGRLREFVGSIVRPINASGGQV